MVASDATVLVCTRNRPLQLERCLNSILQLRTPPRELIVVDNASVHFEVPKLNYNIPTKFFSYPIPGLSRARNSVLADAKGEIVALIDDDAVADPDWLSKA